MSQAQYRTFAERTEQEGRRGDAALFRAAAHPERVRARMHSDVIRRLGVDPRPPSLETASAFPTAWADPRLRAYALLRRG